MNTDRMRRIDRYVALAGSPAQTAVTAAGGGDTTAINGPTIDRMGTGSGLLERYASAACLVSARATMASGETLKAIAKFQDSPNDSDWTDYGDASPLTTVVSAVGGAASAEVGYMKHGVDLTMAKRYVRAVVTPDLSRAGTDTAVVNFVVALGGSQNQPVDQPANT